MMRFAGLILLVALSLSAAPIENVLSFQGKLVEGGTPVDGTRNITFRLYDVATGGTHLWEESHIGVPIVGGLFNVELGGSVNFAGAGVSFDEQYWIGISVGGGAEVSPRYKLTSSAYSMAPWTIDAEDIYRETGNVGIGTNSPVYKLHVNADGGGSAVYGFTDALFIDDFGIIGAQDVSTCWGGLGGYTVEGNDVGVYGVQGTGNYAGYFDGGVFVDGQISISGGSPGAGKVLTSNASGLATWETPASGTDDDWAYSTGSGLAGYIYHYGHVGIGTNSPDQYLDINPDAGPAFIQAKSSDGHAGLIIDRGPTVGNGYIIYTTDGASGDWFVGQMGDDGDNGWGISESYSEDGTFHIEPGGNIGIGTTSPSQLLHVDGDARVTGAYYDSDNNPGAAGQVLSSTGAGTDWIVAADEDWTLFGSYVYRTSGNVGIGTSSPTYKLHVVGNTLLVGNTLIEGTLKTDKHSSSAVPLAYGRIASDGSISSSTSNVTSSVWNSTYDRYEITISDESYYGPTFPTIVTPSGSSPRIACSSSVSGMLLVHLFSLSGDDVQCAFSFVIYKP